MWDHLYTNATLATMTDSEGYGLLEHAAIAVKDGRITWIGSAAELTPQQLGGCKESCDVGGKLITPGLIDCHTHLVYGGSRAGEFEQRLEGATYEEIARAGGGIRSTVRATREASEKDLLLATGRRLQSLMNEGVTTIEIKSGYGLDLETERRCLRIARMLGEQEDITVKTTYLGAHALPPEWDGRADDYIDFVCDQVMPKIAEEGLADAVDAFCEGIGFSPEQTRRVFQAAQRHNIPVKLHAEQLSDLGGAALAASFGALSADHLEYLSEDGAKAMAAVGTVAVLLPGAFYFLKETKKPPVDLLRRYGVPIAISTDANPGSSPCSSLILMLNMACTFFAMTPAEALAGVTRNAAKALGLKDRGVLEVGKRADLVLWDTHHPAELSYRFGLNPCVETMVAGVVRQ